MPVATLSQLTVRLEEAEAALHALATGTAAVEVTDSNGEKLVYNRASISELRKYVADLQAQIDAIGAASKAKAYGPLTPYF